MIERLDFEQRYVAGKVTGIYTNYIDLEIREPLQGIQLARVYRNHWPPGKSAWSVGEYVDRAFVYSLSTEGRRGHAGRHWFASALWGLLGSNPWERSHHHHPVLGQVLEGEVIRVASSRDVILHIAETQMEGFLNLREVPDGRTMTIAELLPLGLKVMVKTIEIDSHLCKIEFSVLERLADLERQQGRGPHEIGKSFGLTPYLRFAEGESLAQPHSKTTNAETKQLPWEGRGVLILDDDKNFSRNLISWLQQFGAQAWAADNAKFAGDLLTKNSKKITHVMLDHSLGSRQVRADMLSLLKRHRKGRAVAVISGLPETEAPQLAERLGFAFLPKPIRFEWANAWLTHGKAPSMDLSTLEPAAYWRSSSTFAPKDLAERGRKWLSEVCRQANAKAAVWIRCYRPGYSLVAAHGLGTRQNETTIQDVLLRLNLTLVAGVEQDGKTHSKDSDNSKERGPLAAIWPTGAQCVWAGPLYETPDQRLVDDVLLVFSISKLDLQHREAAWSHLHSWWRDLLALERAQDHLSEEMIFATQGRVHAATLHELRPLMQAFESPRPWSVEAALEWWPQGQKAKHLINSGLYNIRPERIAQVNLRNRIQTLMDTFLWQLISRREVTVVVHLPPPDLTIFLPPEVLEQPLINLVDNATKFCARRRWARVEIHVFVDEADVKHPLVVRVTDQGSGVTPEEARNLFRPRHTATGEGGIGMGLYVSATLAKAVGGALQLVSSSRWGGSIFELRLPLAWGERAPGAVS